MITRFGTLFAGHVDLEDMGWAGTPVNDRWLPDEHLTTVFDKSVAMAELMDRVGFETLWFAEHHFQREGYECIPNVLMLAIHLSHLTKNLKIGWVNGSTWLTALRNLAMSSSLMPKIACMTASSLVTTSSP